jgi:hypothetical protein
MSSDTLSFLRGTFRDIIRTKSVATSDTLSWHFQNRAERALFFLQKKAWQFQTTNFQLQSVAFSYNFITGDILHFLRGTFRDVIRTKSVATSDTLSWHFQNRAKRALFFLQKKAWQFKKKF